MKQESSLNWRKSDYVLVYWDRKTPRDNNDKHKIEQTTILKDLGWTLQDAQTVTGLDLEYVGSRWFTFLLHHLVIYGILTRRSCLLKLFARFLGLIFLLWSSIRHSWVKRFFYRTVCFGTRRRRSWLNGFLLIHRCVKWIVSGTCLSVKSERNQYFRNNLISRALF